jgi:glycosyltransferase involved in cell wall biosynthesis
MRIALVTETFLPKVDGIVNTLCHLLEHLADRGHTSLLLAPAGGPARYASTEVIGFPTLPFPLYPELRLVTSIPAAMAHLKRFKPDIVHVINPVWLGVAGLWRARSLGLPGVASYHTDVPGFAARWGLHLAVEPLRRYLRWIHNQADLNLCPSRATQLDLEAHGFERVKVWSRGVNAERFHPRHRSAAWRHTLTGGHSDAPLLLFAGRLAPEKRIDWLRAALDAIPQARLAIVGDGPSRPALEQMFNDGRTVFTGYLRGDDLARAYAAADAFIFPGANETFGNVVLEAMASGLPVVAAQSGGVLDFVTEGVSGLLFDPEDKQSLVEAARAIVTDTHLARRLSAEARAVAESRRWEAVLDGLLDDYAEVIAQAGARPRRVTGLTGQTVGSG